MNINNQNTAVFGKGKTGSKVISTLKEKYGIDPVVFDSKNPPNEDNLKHIQNIVAFVPSEILNTYLELFMSHNILLVSGATGQDWPEELKEKIKKLNLTWITGSNFSLGMRVIYKMIGILEKAKTIWPSVEINIHEVHHTKKIDGPSGTALSWGEWINLKDKSAITFSREGDVVGDHTLEFKTENEKISLRHEALDRSLFAEGALFALEYLVKNHATIEPGLHYFEDITNKELI